jgi:hypothetical protein
LQLFRYNPLVTLARGANGTAEKAED